MLRRGVQGSSVRIGKTSSVRNLVGGPLTRKVRHRKRSRRFEFQFALSVEKLDNLKQTMGGIRTGGRGMGALKKPRGAGY